MLYPLKKTLRFPRVIRVREDKDWSGVHTVAELEGEKVEKPTVLLGKKRIETVESTVFKGVNVFLANGKNKSDLEKAVFRNGGTVTSTFVGSLTNLVVAEEIDLRLKNILNATEIDILLPIYLEECIKAGKLIPKKPNFYLHCSRSTSSSLSTKFDKFGDSFTDQLSMEEYKQTLASVTPTTEFNHALSALNTQYNYSFMKYFK